MGGSNKLPSRIRHWPQNELRLVGELLGAVLLWRNLHDKTTFLR